MDEAREGVDWHRDGAPMPGWLLCVLLALMGAPTLLAVALIVGMAKR